MGKLFLVYYIIDDYDDDVGFYILYFVYCHVIVT